MCISICRTKSVLFDINGVCVQFCAEWTDTCQIPLLLYSLHSVKTLEDKCPPQKITKRMEAVIIWLLSSKAY